VVSSTTHLTLGSGCPIVVRDSNFFEMMPNEVLKYRNLEELEQALTSAFTKDEKYEAVMRAAKKYVEKNSAEKVAEKFISLFESLS
jgi:glycosyltransferase involved in cell wall biosynthesis